MGFLKGYAKKYGNLFLISILFLIVEAVCDLLQPTIMARIVDQGVANRDLAVVLSLSGKMLIITAIGALGAVGRNLLSSNVSQRFGADLRSDLFSKVQRLPLASLNRFETGGLITRLTNDVTQMQEFVHRLMRVFVRAPILAVGAAGMAIYLSPGLAVVLAVVIPLATSLVVLSLKMGFPYFRRVQGAIDGLNKALREYLSGVRVVKAFNRSAYEKKRFETINLGVAESSMAAERVMAFFSPSIMLVVNLGIVAVLWLGGISVRAGNLQVGKIIAFVNYMTQMLHALRRIFIVFARFVRAKASAERIQEIFLMDGKRPQTASGEPPLKGAISFQNVSFSYGGNAGQPVLKDISFQCSPGETVGIVGPTGAGKSTLAKLILKFYAPTAGKIEIDGRDLQTIDTRDLREAIGFVPQQSLLFSGSVLANLRWANPRLSLEEVRQWARVAQIDDFVAGLPGGYDTIVGQGGVNLSGGQKQRLALLRALLKKPQILILDDSTSALDAVTESKIRVQLGQSTKEMTTILISQRITSVLAADGIAVLDEGTLVGWGAHSELIENCAVYQEMYRSQVGSEGAIGNG